MLIKKDPDTIEPYLIDASNHRGRADEILIPESIDELREAIRQCYDNDKPMTISAAGTGLAGGRVPEGGAVISVEKLDYIEKPDRPSQSIKSDAGAVVADIIDASGDAGLLYPPDPTETSSMIGGNAATNASGAKTFKYGPTRKYINAAKIILPDGDLVHLKRGERRANGNLLEFTTESGREYSIDLPEIKMPHIKHAAGYYIAPEMDALDLFIGSEGTLGVFAELELALVEAPEEVLGGIAFFESYDNLFAFVDELRRISIENNLINYKECKGIAARLIELYDQSALRLVGDKYPQLPAGAMAAIWFEQEYIKPNEDAILGAWVDMIGRFTPLAELTWVAMSQSEHAEFREFRHAIPSTANEINSRKNQRKIGTDIAVPDKYIYDLYKFIQNKISGSGLDFAIWGHIGNSHIHANVFAGQDELSRGYEFYDQCIAKALDFGGTVSAEHGIGKIKKKYLRQMFGERGIREMRDIKKIIDPKNLLGRGNLFD
ncbi:MAG: FAD-binding oxidoreductase [Candidatus Kapaibacterium sp.]